MKDYKVIFDQIESTLIAVGSKNLPVSEIKRNLDHFKHFESKEYSDEDYYWLIIQVIFYAGFKAATVNSKLSLIRSYFPDYKTVAKYSEQQVHEMLADPKMIRNKRKILACIENACVFQDIIQIYGSFDAYILSFSASDSFENLMLLKEELEYKFSGFGKVTTYHFLTDIGLPVLKPDRVICRIFRRLGLIESDQQLLKTIIQGRKFAEITGHPIRYIDIVFVAYGQMEFKDFGLERGICLKTNPSCSRCGVKEFCSYEAKS
ncbi:MAG: DNA-3-methyladenine glycosylase I [Anaerolineae bacterium]|nr:DNA-3-methyladenine glycosylase I [Anaerolineae bacterium]